MHFLSSLWEKWKYYFSNHSLISPFIPLTVSLSLPLILFSSGSHPFNFLSPDTDPIIKRKHMIRQTSLETNTFFSPERLRESITKAMMETQLHVFPLTEEATFIIKQIDAFPLEGWECHTCLSQSDSQNTHFESFTSVYRYVPLLIEDCYMMQRTLDKKAYFREIKCRILSNIHMQCFTDGDNITHKIFCQWISAISLTQLKNNHCTEFVFFFL